MIRNSYITFFPAKIWEQEMIMMQLHYLILYLFISSYIL